LVRLGLVRLGLWCAAGWLVTHPPVSVAQADDAAVSPQDEIVADENLAGVWQLKRAVNQGDLVPRQELTGSRVIVRENSIAVRDAEDNERYRCTYTFDHSSTPWKIDMGSKLPGKPPATAKGIYRIKDDRWILCYGLPGAERPEEFHSPEDSSLMLMKMKRPPQVD